MSMMKIQELQVILSSYLCVIVSLCTGVASRKVSGQYKYLQIIKLFGLEHHRGAPLVYYICVKYLLMQNKVWSLLYVDCITDNSDCKTEIYTRTVL